jgi:protocatechuate 3,4-dioxygenase beta subunit
MSTKLMIPVAAVAVLGLLWAVRDVGRSARSELASPAKAETVPVAPLEPPESMRPIETSKRLAVEPAQSATATLVENRAESTDAAARSIHGAVLDERGSPLAGVPVALVERGGKDLIPGTERITDARGEFELTLPKKKVELDVPSPEWVVVLRPALSLEAGDEHVFVLAPPRAVAGEVVDETGRPLRAAKLELVMPDLRAAIERVLDRCVDQHWRTESSEDGAFVFDPVPDLEACSLRSTLPGYEARTLELAPGDHGDLRIVMTHPLEARAIHGQVVDELGKPVQGAHVALSADPGGTESRLLAVSTDAGGLFELRLTDADRDARLLRAVKAGKLPAEVSCNSDTPWSPGAWPDPLVLVLRGSVLSIEGVVLDPDGHPVPFAAIANLDASRFGTVEAEWSGTRVEVGEDIEALLAGRSSASGPSASADERGRFELRGLLPKSYRLSAFSSATMQLVVTDPIEAGRRGVEIRFPREERIERIAGRVVSKSGRGLAGAQLWLARRTTPPAATSVRAGDRELTGYGIQADGEGRFEFRDVPLSVERICARSAPQTPEATVMLGGRTDLENLRIVVPLECHFKLDLTGSPLRATSVRVLDAAGQSISFGIHRGNLWINSDEQQVDAATSEAFTVSEDAAMLVLYDADRELARVPLNLVPGELVIVRP